MSDEHQVKPIAWAIAAGILAASIAGSVFVTYWTPMKRKVATIPAQAAGAPRPSPQFRLPLEKPTGPPATAPEAAAAFSDGIGRLFGGDAGGAIEPLSAAVRMSTGSAEQDARWYLAVALERSGRPTDATVMLDELCRRDGPRRDQACAARTLFPKP